jgi:hypothetical protein
VAPLERLGALFRLALPLDRDGVLFLDAELFLLFDDELLDTELFLLFDDELFVTELLLLLVEEFLEAEAFLFVVCLFTELFLFVAFRFDTELFGRDLATLLPLEGRVPPTLLLRFPFLETELSFLAIPLVVLLPFTLLLFLLITSLRPRVALLSFLAIPLVVFPFRTELLSRFAIPLEVPRFTELFLFPLPLISLLLPLLALLTAEFLRFEL